MINDTKGIRFKLLAYFFIFSVIILALLWMLQVVFLNSFYQMMKRNETEALGEDIVSNYGRYDYADYVREIAFKNELTVMVFTIEGNTIFIDYSGGRGSFAGSQELAQYLNEFIAETDNNSVVSYLTSEQEGMEMFVYGEKKVIGDETVYFYINASLIPVGSTTSVLSSQLIIVTIICIMLALGISFFISGTLSKPLIEITKSAEKLAAGDLNANFNIPGSYSEIQKLSETLNYATSELSKTDNLRKELIANVSHEIKTPLTMIKAYTEHIRDISGNNESKREMDVQIILAETDRLNRLVNDILDLSKLQAGLLKFNIEKFDISQSIQRTLNKFIGIYECQGYTFIKDIENDVIIEGDESKLEQVMYNLIGNAVNYSGDRKEITVTLKVSFGACRLEISDRGFGINPEELPYVFDRYFRTREGGRLRCGSGIGLSIVKSILEGHNYKYGVHSAIGEGSNFYVVIPIKA